MEIFEGVKGLASLGTALGISSVLLGSILVAWLVWRRTRSTHSLMTRLWARFDRNSKNTDQAIATFLSGQTNLMQFRFTTGVPARTLAQAHKLINWTSAHNENIDAVKACGEYFDIERPGLKEPSKLPGIWTLGPLFTIFITFFVAASLVAVGAIQSSAILRTKDSGLTFLLSKDNAVMLWSDVSFGTKQCKEDRAAITLATEFKGFEVDAICDLIVDGRASEYVRTNVQLQRVMLPFISGFLATIALMCLAYVSCGVNANAMSARLAKRACLALDFADDGKKAAQS